MALRPKKGTASTRVPSALQHRILWALTREETGPDLYDIIAERMDDEDLSVDSFYTALHRMVTKDKWVKRERDKKGTDARVNRYWITAEGKKAFARGTRGVAELHLRFSPDAQSSLVGGI